jgi:hypothetical protein
MATDEEHEEFAKLVGKVREQLDVWFAAQFSRDRGAAGDR